MDTRFKPFDAAALLANRGLLNSGGSGEAGEGMREVFFSPGMQVVVPDMSLAGMIVVSVLVGLQVLVLVGLMVWIYRVRTWAGAFDAKALVGVGVSLGKEGRFENIEGRELEGSGIFGVTEGREGRADGRGGVELGLGGEGTVGRRARMG